MFKHTKPELFVRIGVRSFSIIDQSLRQIHRTSKIKSDSSQFDFSDVGLRQKSIHSSVSLFIDHGTVERPDFLPPLYKAQTVASISPKAGRIWLSIEHSSRALNTNPCPHLTNTNSQWKRIFISYPMSCVSFRTGVESKSRVVVIHFFLTAVP